MQNWVTALSSSLPVSLVGRKAAALGELIENGFPVPSSVCITTEAFQTAISSENEDLSMPEGLMEEMISILNSQAPLAVRSSAVFEDLPETSHAGRYATHLNVIGPIALEQAILDCWRSYLAVRSTEEEGGIAVLVQPMLDAECAGVRFTIDPVRQRPDLLLVVSAWGLGAGVVGGSIPTDTARLRRTDLGVEDFSIADKHTALRPALSGDGIMVEPISEDHRTIPCLSESWLERVGQFGLACEQVFGAPQDVEWAVANGQLWILQSRPVTALPAEMRAASRFPIAWADAEEPRHFWWMEGIGSHNGAPLLPAELDFIHINTNGGQDAVYFKGTADTRWRKDVNGRVYMAAANSPHSPGHVRVYGTATRDLYERLAQQGVTWWEYWGPEITRATDRLAAFDASGSDGRTLADHLEDAIATATRHWMIHTIVPGRPIRSAALLDLYARVTGLPPGELAADMPFILAGFETIQTRLVEALYDLACLALELPESAKQIGSGNWAKGKADAPALKKFASGYQRLIAIYGDRLCYRRVPGIPVETPQPWREAPNHVWEMIAAYLPLARQGGPGPREARLETLRAADAKVEAICSKAVSANIDPGLVNEFRQKLAYARRNAAYIEEHNHHIDQLSEGQYVQALLYAGDWLAGHGNLPNPFDIFWLRTDEILDALHESAGALDGVIAERQAQFKEWQALIAPACLGLPDPRLPERPVSSSTPAGPGRDLVDKSGNTLSGEPACRGQAVGRARLIMGDALPADIVPGDILVAPFANSVLIPFLPAITAIVLDYGGPGDHFAITAREFGVPAVCATLYATHRIPEGAWITVDAYSGLITWDNPE